MEWTAVWIADPRALLVLRSILIAMMLAVAIYAKTKHVKASFGLYALWKIIEALNSPVDPLTYKLFTLYLIQVYMMFGIFVAIENRKRSGESALSQPQKT